MNSKIGLGPLAERVADAALSAARGKRSARETRRRLAAAVLPLLAEAVEIGLDQALIASAGQDAATLAILARKRALPKDAP